MQERWLWVASVFPSQQWWHTGVGQCTLSLIQHQHSADSFFVLWSQFLWRSDISKRHREIQTPLNFHDPLDALAWQITGKTTVLNWARGRNKQLYPSISTVAINTIGKTSGRTAHTSLPPQQTKLETGSAGSQVEHPGRGRP